MPELPEVTTFINNIKDKIINKKIIDIIINNNKVIKNATNKEFKEFFMNEKFLKIERKGKYFIFFLSNNKSFVLHLRMEGKIIFHLKNDPLLNSHNLVTWIFDNNEELRYYDTRLFGTMHIYYSDPYLNDKSLSKVGLEPFDDKCDLNYLKNKMQKHPKTNLKTLLLDQSIIAGIGNIYADEILFACKLNPTWTIIKLNDEDYLNIINNTKMILNNAIKANGTTVASYSFDNHFNIGKFQEQLKVHTRNNLPCYECKNLIKKTKLNGRGTYYCSSCQGEVYKKSIKKHK